VQPGTGRDEEGISPIRTVMAITLCGAAAPAAIWSSIRCSSQGKLREAACCRGRVENVGEGLPVAGDNARLMPPPWKQCSPTEAR